MNSASAFGGQGMRPQDLLENLDWLRRLARQLVLDMNDAEDLVQEAVLVALENPPREVGALRAWLRTVTRNLAFRGFRGAARRKAREQRSASAEASESTVDEVLERAELQRALVDEVWKLREPYKTTVILHYFDGMKPAQIADQLGVEVSAVRMRLSRAHRELHQELHQLYQGNRRALAVALVGLYRAPLRGSRNTTTVRLGASLATAAALVAMIAGVWFLSGSGSDPDSNPGAQTAAGPNASATGAPSAAESERRVVGTVRDVDTGLMIEGATVRMQLADGRGVVASTDRDGSFDFNRRSVESATITVSDARYVATQDPWVLDADSPTEIDEGILLVHRAATVEGHITDRTTGAALADRVIGVFERGETKPQITTQTRLDGSFTLVGIAPGRYVVNPLNSDDYPLLFSDQRVQVEARWGSIFESVDFALRPALDLEGLVLDAQGEGVAGATVSAWHPRTAEVITTTSGAAGRFHWRMVDPGDYTLTLRASTKGLSSAANRGLSGSELREEIELTLLPVASVSGQLHSSRDLFHGDQQLELMNWSHPGLGLRTRTDARGAFRFSNVPAGIYDLLGTRVPVAAGEVIEGLEVTLPERSVGEISGYVVDAWGRRVQARVELVGHPVSTSLRSEESDASGFFRFTGLPLQEFGVRIRKDGFVPTATVVTPGSAVVELTLQPWSTVQARIVDATSGKPLGVFEHRRERGMWTREANADGMLERQVGGETSTVSVKAKGYLPTEFDFSDLTPGTTQMVDLGLEPFGSCRIQVRSLRGDPVGGATIAWGHSPGAAEGSELLESDPQGFLTVARLPEPYGEFHIVHSDFASTAVEYVAAELSGITLEVTLRERAELNGVVWQRGEPQEGLTVIAFVDGDRVESTTDDAGCFALQVPPGVINLQLLRAGEVLRTRVVHAAPGGTERVEFTLSPGTCRVFGQVRLGSELPASGEVMLVRSDGTGTLVPVQKLDEEGRFDFTEVPSGSGVLTVTALFESGRQTRAEPIELEEAEELERVVDFAGGHEFSLNISGTPSDHQVTTFLLRGHDEVATPLTLQWLQTIAAQRVVAHQQRDGDGPILFKGIAKGPYTLLVFHVVPGKFSPEQLGTVPRATREIEVTAESPGTVEIVFP